MIAYLVVEGPADGDILRSVLGPEALEGVQIVAAGDLAAAKSAARTILVSRRTPLAIVADAETTVPEGVKERGQGIEEIVGSVAGPTPFRAILAVPSLADLFSQLDDATASRRSSFIEEVNRFLREARQHASRTAPVLG